MGGNRAMIWWIAYIIGVFLAPVVIGLLSGKNAKFLPKKQCGIIVAAILWPGKANHQADSYLCS